MGQDTHTEPRALFKLLSDEGYWQMLSSLARSDMRLGELAAQISRTPNQVELHLATLRAAGLVVERRSDSNPDDIYYQLSLGELRRQYQMAGAALHPALSGDDTHEPPAKLPETLPRVLFLCTHNSARSQMAEGLLRSLSRDQVAAYSAGTEPSRVNPHAIEVMQSLKIDITGQRSKHLDEFMGQQFDYVITVCDNAREVCPTFPGAGQQLHWSIPDPSAVAESAQHEAFRQVSTILTTRIRYLVILIERDIRERKLAMA